MSTKLVLLAAAAILFLVVCFTSKGIHRVLLIVGLLAIGLLGTLFWTGRLSVPELMQSMKESFNA